MSRRSRAILAVLLGLLVFPSEGVAAEPRIVNLRVTEPPTPWSSTDSFKLAWSLDAAGSSVATVELRVLSTAHGGVSPFTPMPPEPSMTKWVYIAANPHTANAAPGIYRAEVWASTADGRGPSQFVDLRFDDVRPGQAQPWLDAAWYRPDVPPVLRIAHPEAPLPISGIRGYAVSLRLNGAQPPCAAAERCTEAETDLPGGIGDDTMSLGLLPEGSYVASVVAVSNSGMSSAIASVPVGIDGTRPDLVLEGAGGGWSNGPVRVVARASDPLSGMLAAGPSGPRTTVAVDGGAPVVAQGDEVATVVGGSGVHSVAAGARDAAGNARGEDKASPPLAGIVRIDESPPAVAFARSGDPSDPELLEATVADALSGPAGGLIGVRPRGSAQAFQPLPTRSGEGRLSARWDSDSHPPGSYEFRVTGYDAAGNAASTTLRANGAPMVLANPVKVPSAVRFGFGGRQLVWQRCVRRGESRRCRREVIEPFGRRPAARVVPYGRSVQVGGQAIAATGAPLAGVDVALVETFDPGATASSRVTHLRTGPDGTFFGRLAPGPSRQVEARFGGTNLLTRANSRGLRLGVQTAVRFRASTARAAIGGRPVVFRGRVLRSAASIPAYGRPVQLQFRLPGTPWTEFRSVQTDRAGRFEYPYSFSDDDSRGVRFMFRAYAPPQPGWPYEPGASRPLAVTGY